MLRGALRFVRTDLCRLRTFDLLEIAVDQTVASELVVPSGVEVAVLADGATDRDAWTREALCQRVANAARRLRAGAVAVCVTVDGELANLSWLACTVEARRACERIPYPVNFAEGEACIPWSGTYAGFRHRGFGALAIGTTLRYLAARGTRSLRFAVAVKNRNSQRLASRFDARRCERFTMLCVLGLRFALTRRRVDAAPSRCD